MKPERMRVDLHVHSEVSHDCRTRLSDIPDWCLLRGVRVLAITDHDQQRGGPALQALIEERGLQDDLFVVCGEEVTTSEGELIGLFLQERIAPGLSPEETVRQIKAQGGLVMLQHGFDPLKRYRLRPEATQRIAQDIDIVEALNARLSRPAYNRAAADWAAQRRLPVCAGSDAHTLRDIGEAYVEAPFQPVRTPQQLLDVLWQGKLQGRWTPPAYAFMRKQWRQWRGR